MTETGTAHLSAEERYRLLVEISAAANSRRFQLADGGSIFLAEVGELPPEIRSLDGEGLQRPDFECACWRDSLARKGNGP